MTSTELDLRELCVDLLKADTEKEVIDLLRSYGYWDNPTMWRPFGGKDDNFPTTGNQSSTAHGALVEKLVNSVDAVLMGECWVAGIRPNSPDATRSIREAVARFFYNEGYGSESNGLISNWSTKKRTEVSDRITLSATGTRSNPCFTVVDSGEGQSPYSMPDTLLSLDKQNKIDIHFVQGKFNMGGTGAFRFCGTDNLQLIVSRRNPKIKVRNQIDKSIDLWGFTIVRRENPTQSMKLSTYKYLVGDQGDVFQFESETLPLFPNGNQAYAQNAEWGTAVKLYEYQIKGKSHILRRDGLLSTLDLSLPEIALPIRMHECRDYRGHRGSFDTTLSGLKVRLQDDKAEKLEPGFPTSGSLMISNQKMSVEVYAFKRGQADSYRTSQGVIVTVNGQTHGTMSNRFFSRKTVGMDRLKDSILVIMDCSNMDGRSREDLFMNDRERMQQGELLSAIERGLESMLKEHQPLKDLREKRRSEDVREKLEDSKPFTDVLNSIIAKSPSLSSLFGQSGPLSNPFQPSDTKGGNGFQPKLHPTKFLFDGLRYGEDLSRNTHINMRSRIAFETDVVNDYFTRGHVPGHHSLTALDGNHPNGAVPDHTLNLQNGTATLNLSLPDNAQVGDTYNYEFQVDDPTLMESFVNRFAVSVLPTQDSSRGNGSRKSRSSNRGRGQNDASTGLQLPSTVDVYEADWAQHGFDKNSALKAVYDPPDTEGATGSHTYYLNMDNIFLNTELKSTNEDADIVRSRWRYGMALIAMALIQAAASREEIFGGNQDTCPLEGKTAEEEVSLATTAIAPVLLPLIEHLGALTEDDVTG